MKKYYIRAQKTKKYNNKPQTSKNNNIKKTNQQERGQKTQKTMRRKKKFDTKMHIVRDIMSKIDVFSHEIGSPSAEIHTRNEASVKSQQKKFFISKNFKKSKKGCRRPHRKSRGEKTSEQGYGGGGKGQNGANSSKKSRSFYLKKTVSSTGLELSKQLTGHQGRQTSGRNANLEPYMLKKSPKLAKMNRTDFGFYPQKKPKNAILTPQGGKRGTTFTIKPNHNHRKRAKSRQYRSKNQSQKLGLNKVKSDIWRHLDQDRAWMYPKPAPTHLHFARRKRKMSRTAFLGIKKRDQQMRQPKHNLDTSDSSSDASASNDSNEEATDPKNRQKWPKNRKNENSKKSKKNKKKSKRRLKGGRRNSRLLQQRRDSQRKGSNELNIRSKSTSSKEPSELFSDYTEFQDEDIKKRYTQKKQLFPYDDFPHRKWAKKSKKQKKRKNHFFEFPQEISGSQVFVEGVSAAGEGGNGGGSGKEGSSGLFSGRTQPGNGTSLKVIKEGGGSVNELFGSSGALDTPENQLRALLGQVRDKNDEKSKIEKSAKNGKIEAKENKMEPIEEIEHDSEDLTRKLSAILVADIPDQKNDPKTQKTQKNNATAPRKASQGPGAYFLALNWLQNRSRSIAKFSLKTKKQSQQFSSMKDFEVNLRDSLRKMSKSSSVTKIQDSTKNREIFKIRPKMSMPLIEEDNQSSHLPKKRAMHKLSTIYRLQNFKNRKNSYLPSESRNTLHRCSLIESELLQRLAISRATLLTPESLEKKPTGLYSLEDGKTIKFTKPHQTATETQAKRMERRKKNYQVIMTEKSQTMQSFSNLDKIRDLCLEFIKLFRKLKKYYSDWQKIGNDVRNLVKRSFENTYSSVFINAFLDNGRLIKFNNKKKLRKMIRHFISAMARYKGDRFMQRLFVEKMELLLNKLILYEREIKDKYYKILEETTEKNYFQVFEKEFNFMIEKPQYHHFSGKMPRVKDYFAELSSLIEGRQGGFLSLDVVLRKMGTSRSMDLSAFDVNVGKDNLRLRGTLEKFRQLC